MNCVRIFYLYTLLAIPQGTHRVMKIFDTIHRFATEANFMNALSKLLSPNGALFVTLATIIFVLEFGTLDLVIAIFTINIRGQTYGIDPWLKQGRADWIHQKQNFFAECLSCIIQILEDGFGMFNAQPPPKSATDGSELDTNLEFTCSSVNSHVVLKIEHRIDPKKTKEYKQWVNKIDKTASRHARGLIDVKKSEFRLNDNILDEEMGSETFEYSTNKDGMLQTIHITFENIAYLNDWMQSKKRQKLLEDLEPLLMSPDLVKIRNDRKLPDPLTDLLVQQGEPAPLLRPKKWKVWSRE